MSKSYVRAMVAAVALAVGGLTAPMTWSQSAPPAPKTSPSLAKTFKAAQDAQAAKRWPEVIARAQEVLASSGRKPDDTYYAYYLMFEAHRATGNTAEVRKALDGVVDSGFLNPAQQATFLKPLMSIALQSKDYDGAVNYGNRLVKNGSTDPEVSTIIGQAYYQKGAFGESAKYFSTLVTDQIKAGKTPREQDLQLLQSANAKLGNKNAETDALEKLVVYYPKTNYWDNLLFSVRSNPKLDPRQKLQVYRLMMATGTLKQGSDYNMFAEYATGAGLPAEAHKVFEAGLKANAFKGDDLDRANRRMTAAAKTAEADKANLAKQEAEARAAATGELDVAVGMAYYSYGDFAKAVESLQRGIGKGGLKEAQLVEAPVVLGMAQVRAKDNAGALKTFQGIKTANPEWQRIAGLWALYAK